jgi:hypothetical protein
VCIQSRLGAVFHAEIDASSDSELSGGQLWRTLHRSVEPSGAEQKLNLGQRRRAKSGIFG